MLMLIFVRRPSCINGAMGIASKPVHGKLNHIAQHLLTVYLIGIQLIITTTTATTTVRLSCRASLPKP